MFQSLIFETRTVSYYKKIIDQYKEFNRIKNRVLKTREKEKNKNNFKVIRRHSQGIQPLIGNWFQTEQKRNKIECPAQ